MNKASANDPANTVAFQGELGANSHIACREAFPDMHALACPTFEDVFAAVEEGRAKLEIGLAKGKKQHDKRATEKDRDWQRDKARVMRRG